MKNSNIDLVDFHSHILPGVDHGSHSLNTSKKQLELAHSAGVTRIISTSHFYPHMTLFDEFIEKRNQAFKNLVAEVNIADVDIRLGAEVLLCDNLQNFENLDELCINGTKYMLLELPFSGFNYSMVESVESIISMDYNVVLAHADRYPKEHIEEFIETGAKIQLNASSLATVFKNKHLYSWIERGLVVGIGSDIHGADAEAYRKFNIAKGKLGEALLEIVEKSNEIWNKALLL